MPNCILNVLLLIFLCFRRRLTPIALRVVFNKLMTFLKYDFVQTFFSEQFEGIGKDLQRLVFMSIKCLGFHSTSTIIVNCSALSQLRVLVGLRTIQQRFLPTIVGTRGYLLKRDN